VVIPVRQLLVARDTQRKNDLTEIANAIYQYSAENGGKMPAGITTKPTHIGTLAGFVNVSILVPTYLAQLPKDPASGTPGDTQYSIYKDTEGRVVITAQSEVTQGNIISVVR
jgi:hypothetical protein